MNEFTVEVVLKPVKAEDWSVLRRVTDLVPGTILLEDPAEPMLIIPIEADTQSGAAVFVQGAMSVLGLDIVWGRAYRTERAQYELGPDAPANSVPNFAPKWLEDPADTERVRQTVCA